MTWMDLKRDRTHERSHKNSDRTWHVNDGFKHAHGPNRVNDSSLIKRLSDTYSCSQGQLSTRSVYQRHMHSLLREENIP